MKNLFQDLKRKDHKRYLGGLDVFKYGDCRIYRSRKLGF